MKPGRALLATVFLSAALAGQAAAQNRGKDPAKFELTHFSAHGQWELFCGHFGDPDREKCDLRRTDILSPRPRFRAMVTWLRFEAGGPVMNIDAEPGTIWIGGGLKIDGRWYYRMDRCLSGRCPLPGAAVAGFLDRLAGARSVSLAFTDILAARRLDWDLADLRAAVAELAMLRKEKGLP